MKNYELHYASMQQFETGEDIVLEKFGTFKSLKKHLTVKLYPEYDKKGNPKVYKGVKLVSFKEEVFVSEEIDFIIDFIEFIHHRAYNEFADDTKVFLQEYASFEDAYAVALPMKEISPLCYRKNK